VDVVERYVELRGTVKVGPAVHAAELVAEVDREAGVGPNPLACRAALAFPGLPVRLPDFRFRLHINTSYTLFIAVFWYTYNYFFIIFLLTEITRFLGEKKAAPS